jgi:hypothetical protein
MITPIKVVQGGREQGKRIATEDQINEDQAKKETPSKNRYCGSMVENKD